MDFKYKEFSLTDIEGLSTNTDDFLSNGFHQFYNELHEEHLDFEPLVSSISWVDEIGVSEEHDYLKQGWVDSTCLNSDIGQVEVSYIQTDEPFATLDLDYILMDLPYENGQNLLELPEKTPLCNDSCSFFLKESAENLKLPTIVQSSTSMLDIPIIIEYNETPQTNSELRPLHCDFDGCGKTYAKPTHLKAHLKRHLNEKPYICHWPECKWRFSRSDELARHRRSHLGIKPYSCCFCTKSFARSDHLTKHRRVHEKKFNSMSKEERQMIVWPAVPRGRPGRKPKPKAVANDSNDDNIKYFNSNEVIVV